MSVALYGLHADGPAFIPLNASGGIVGAVGFDLVVALGILLFARGGGGRLAWDECPESGISVDKVSSSSCAIFSKLMIRLP